MDLRKVFKSKNLTDLEKLILEYIIENYERVKDIGIRELAELIYVSPASIIRLAKKLGFRGYTDLMYNFESLSSNKDVQTNINYEPLGMILSKNDISHFIALFRNQYDRIFIYATGFSGIVGNYIYKKLLVRGNNAIFVDGSDSIAVFERQIKEMGSFVVISRSGNTPEMISKSKLVKQHEIPIYCFTSNSKSELYELANHSLVMGDYVLSNDKNVESDYFFSESMMIFEYMIGLIDKHVSE